MKALTKRGTTSLALHQLIRALNPILRGWAYYFRFASAKLAHMDSPSRRGMVLLNPATIRVLRYRFRGSKITTPWNDVDPQGGRFRQMSFDETEFLGRVEESLVG